MFNFVINLAFSVLVIAFKCNNICILMQIYCVKSQKKHWGVHCVLTCLFKTPVRIFKYGVLYSTQQVAGGGV